MTLYSPMLNTVSIQLINNQNVFYIYTWIIAKMCLKKMRKRYNLYLFQCECLFCPGVFFLYSGLALLGFVFVVGCLPETKGLRLEEIESLFGRQLCSCGAGGSRSVQYTRVNGGNYRSDEDVTDDE